MPSPLTNHFQNVVTSQPWEVYSNGHFKSFVPPHPPRRTQELYISKTVSKTTMLLRGTIKIWNSTFGERILTIKQDLYRNSVFRYSAMLRESSCLEWNNFASRKYVTSGVLYKRMFHFLSKILHSERSLWHSLPSWSVRAGVAIVESHFMPFNCVWNRKFFICFVCIASYCTNISAL